MEVLKNKLEVRELSKTFDGKEVLQKISFTVREGEFLSVLGPSGCGKTTLLRILIGLEKADSGEIIKENQNILHIPCAERGMGIVFQNYALFPNMTVLQNVEYALKIKKETKSKAREIAVTTLEQVGLADQMTKKPHQLSGGQQQRVAIARTLATSPDVILLDEPISALDVTNREIMKKELKSIQKKFHATMIFITHDQEEAFFLSDRIMILHDGKIEQLDTPSMIYNHPTTDYVRDFVCRQLDKKYEDLLSYTGRSDDETK